MSTQTIHSEGINVSVPTLESVKLDFLNWRSNPYRSAHIPESLWESVILLLSQHSKSKVLTTLGISNAQLTKKLKAREKTSVSALPRLTSTQPITIDNKFVKQLIASFAVVHSTYYQT